MRYEFPLSGHSFPTAWRLLHVLVCTELWGRSQGQGMSLAYSWERSVFATCGYCCYVFSLVCFDVFGFCFFGNHAISSLLFTYLKIELQERPQLMHRGFSCWEYGAGCPWCVFSLDSSSALAWVWGSDNILRLVYSFAHCFAPLTKYTGALL